MHQFLLNAINALINNKFAEAKQWLNKLISSDITTTSPGDIAIVHYVFTYICYLEKDKTLALQHFELIDAKYLPDKSLLQFLIEPQKKTETLRKLMDSAKANTPTPAPQVSNSPTVNSSPYFLSPRGNQVENDRRVVGFELQTNNPSSSSQSSSTRCVDVLQKTPDFIKTNVLNKQVEQFKESHEFWKYLLKTYLFQLGLPEKTKEKNQLSLEKIFTVIAEHKIPLYLLCQNIVSLSKFWRIDGDVNSEHEEDAELKPPMAPLLIGPEPKTPDAKSPPVRGSLAKLLAATTKQSPLHDLNGTAQRDIERVPSSSSLSSSMSSNSKGGTHSSDLSAKQLNQERLINPPILKAGTMLSPPKPIISTPPVSITIPTTAQPPKNNTYSETYIPNAAHHAAPDFLLDEELPNGVSAEGNKSEKQNNNATRQMSVEIQDTPRSVHKRPSLLAQHKPLAENSGPITKPTSDSQSITPAPDKNKIKLKKCMIENNCLAALLLCLSGVRDSADRYEYIPLVPNPTALEMAAYCGNTHCLALMAFTTVDITLFDRALRLALKNAHIDCIYLLLDHVSFSEKVNMYFEIESSHNQKLQVLRQTLLCSHLTLYKALQNDCKILIPELTSMTLKETADEIKGIILRAAELGYDSCLTELRLKAANKGDIDLAVIYAAQNNHIQCLEILLRLDISTKIKINALISLMQNILKYCKENLKEDEWLPYFVTEKSFILFLYYISHIELQEAFIAIARISDPFFVHVLLKLDKLSLVQRGQSDSTLNNRMFLKLDNTPTLNKIFVKPLTTTELQQLDHPENTDEILKLYNLKKIDKIIYITTSTKKIAFTNALKQWNIDTVIALFNTGLDTKDEEEAIKKIAACRNINYQGKLVAYALNNPFTLALLLKLKLNLPSKTALGVIHKVTELGNLDCLKLLLDNGFNINKVDEFHLIQQTPISANTTTNTTANPNVSSMNSLSSLKNLSNAAINDKKITVCTGTIVMIASYLGHSDCLEYLLNRGTGINDPRNPPELRIQLPANCYFKSQRLIVAANSDIPVVQNNTISNNADEFNTCFSGYSALHFAVNNLNCLELLIQAIQVQENKNLKEEEQSLKKGQIIKPRNFKKEMLTLKTTTGDTALHTAALNNKYKSVNVLLKAGADPFQVNYLNEIPLVSAIRANSQDSYNVLIDNKAIYENKPAPVKILREMFEASIKLYNIQRLLMIVECLFSTKINWSNRVEIIEAFQNLLYIIVRLNSFQALSVFKPYINHYFKLDVNENNESLEFLGDIFIALKQRDKYIEIIQFAVNKKSWKIAKSLLEHISSEQHFKAVTHMTDKDAVIFLLKLNELNELIPKEDNSISLNLNP